MKIPIFPALFAATVLLAGCSTTKFTANHDAQVFRGRGGTPCPVDGIDFWSTGDSDRQYKILGLIEDSRETGYFSDWFSRDAAIAKAAHRQGGDAVIFVKGDPVPDSDQDGLSEGWNGEVNQRRHTRFLVIKYVD